MADDDTAYAPTSPGGTATPTQDTVVPVRYSLTPADFELALPDHGYELGGQIGRGGMGEVLAARDRRIGRDVAIKRMTAEHPAPEAIQRFLREARIQARLDHPAIVPVHELGVDAAGRPYFTMKRLTGSTLAQRLKTGGELRPLLHAFVDVCRAITFAHERGVVHRDLKPSNIMLGDYGEVYVLDWGVARVINEAERTSHGGDLDSLDDTTRTGAMLGTPGFMAPEQIRGEPIGPKADVYALGSILFELLAGEALHPRGQAAIANTLAHARQSPAARTPDRAIAPELDRACFDALLEVAAQRPSARELGDRVQRYLDGDRDVERRRELATQLVEQARAVLAARDPEDHAEGMRLAGRALALDPESAEAAALVTSQLLTPPAVLPASCLAAIRAEDARAAFARSRTSGFMVFSVFSLALMIPFLEVRSWTWIIAFHALHLATASYLLWSRGRRRGYLVVMMSAATVSVVLWSQIASPFILTPIMVCTSILGFAANEKLVMRPWITVAWAITAMALPLILEWIGAVVPTATIDGTSLSVTSNMYEIRGAGELASLAFVNVLLIAIVALYALRTSRIAYEGRRSLTIRNWQLDQIVAHAAR